MLTDKNMRPFLSLSISDHSLWISQGGLSGDNQQCLYLLLYVDIYRTSGVFVRARYIKGANLPFSQPFVGQYRISFSDDI